METVSEMTMTVLDRALVAGDAGRVTGERQERPDPVPAARRPDPAPNRRPGHRHQRPLPMARAGITGPVTRSAGESITQLVTRHAGKRQRPPD